MKINLKCFLALIIVFYLDISTNLAHLDLGWWKWVADLLFAHTEKKCLNFNQLKRNEMPNILWNCKIRQIPPNLKFENCQIRP
jgi:hypothetical protein